MRNTTLHLKGDLSTYFPNVGHIAAHGYINWWDFVDKHWDEVQLGELTLFPQADKLVLFFDKDTKECIAFAWTDNYPVAEKLFPDLVEFPLPTYEEDEIPF